MAPLDRMADAVLVQRLRAGHPGAFEALVERHRPRLLAYAKSILRRQPDIAEDVTQEAFMRAHRALLRDEREIMLAPWLLTLTRNCALDELRRVKSDSVPIDAPAAEIALADGAGEPALVHERRSDLRSMLDAIATLPADQRHALVRRAVDGASHREIASELEISQQASRALVMRARGNLVREEKARTDHCSAIQDELLRAHRTGRRASTHAHRHLVSCAGCRGYRRRLRTLERTLALLHPGPGIIGLAALGKVGAGKLGGGASVALKAPAAIGLAVLATAAVGTTTIIRAGQPSPVTVQSKAISGGKLNAGNPLPAGTAIVARSVTAASTVTLSCPPGMRVADLLPPQGRAVTAGYVGKTVPGVSTKARIALGGRSGNLGVAILCRVPQATGSIIDPGQAGSADATTRAVVPRAVGTVCTPHEYLHSTPSGDVIGSVLRGRPLTVLARTSGWREVRTDVGQIGWLSADGVCGAS